MQVFERLRAVGRKRRATLRGLPRRLLVAAPYVAEIAVLELLGRLAAGRLFDLLGCALLLSFVAIEFLRRPWYWGPRLHTGVRSLGRRWLAPFEVSTGLDLRGTPPLPRRVPRAWGWLIASSAVALVLAIAWVVFAPFSALEAIRQVSGALFLLATTITWLALGFTAAITWWILREWLRAEFERARTSVFGVFSRDVAVVLLPCAAAWCAWRGPAGAAVLWIGGVLTLWVLTDIATGSSERHVFRDRDGSLAWTPLGLWISGQLAAPLLGVATLVVLTSGGELFRHAGTDWSFIGLLAGYVGWSVAASAALVQILRLSSLAAERGADPARGYPTRLFVEGIGSRNERQLFQRTVGHFGFLSRFAPGRRRREEVPLVLGSTSRPLDPWQPAPWPATIAWSDLEDDRTHARIRRRDEIQRRRHLIRGLARAFRGARKERAQTGGGTWVAPHLWYFPQLLREDDSFQSPWVGPHFRRVLPRSARAHLFRVLVALEVDAIFVEDGVDYRRFRRVLRMLFEFYDLFGRRPLEERHFTGLPGVRVVLHDSSLDEPFRERRPDEPELDGLGRGRVLHVFRDRGGDEDSIVTAPFQDWIPSNPVLSS